MHPLIIHFQVLIGGKINSVVNMNTYRYLQTISSQLLLEMTPMFDSSFKLRTADEEIICRIIIFHFGTAAVCETQNSFGFQNYHFTVSPWVVFKTQ